MSLNRIYQGRVSYVEIKNSEEATAKETPCLLFHRDPKRAVALTKRIPELREKVEG